MARQRRIPPVFFIPLDERPAACTYTIPNGRSGTLIEISFLIGQTYSVVGIDRTKKGRDAAIE